MYQSWHAIGNLGNDPVQRSTSSGKVVNFSFAVNKQWTSADGEKREKTTWFKVTCWGKLGDIIMQYSKKGNQVLVVGEIEGSSAYLNNEGKPAASTEVTAQTIKFLGGSKAGQTYSADEGGSSAPAEMQDADIPF